MSVAVPITGSSQPAMIDPADADAVGRHTWRVARNKVTYAKATIGGKDVYLHRFLLGLTPGDGLQADHINGDGLDNRRANLRVLNNAANSQNTRAKVGSGPVPSRFRGVGWHGQRRLWRARAKVMYADHALGLYPSELAAALVAERFRQEHMPYSLPDRELLDVLSLAEAA